VRKSSLSTSFLFLFSFLSCLPLPLRLLLTHFPQHFSVLLASFQPHAVAHRSNHFLTSFSLFLARQLAVTLRSLSLLSTFLWELSVSERTRIDRAGYRSRWRRTASQMTRSRIVSPHWRVILDVRVCRDARLILIDICVSCLRSVDGTLDRPRIRDNWRGVAALPSPLSENVVGNFALAPFRESSAVVLLRLAPSWKGNRRLFAHSRATITSNRAIRCGEWCPIVFAIAVLLVTLVATTFRMPSAHLPWVSPSRG